MNADLIIERMDGSMEEAVLVRPFEPQENEIFVKLGKSDEKYSLPLSELCCLHLIPKEMKFSQIENQPEEVLTTTGRTYRVNALQSKTDIPGFFALSLDMSTPFRLIFFSTQGVVSRSQRRRLGEILEDEGLVTRHSIDSTLETQKKLRNRRIGEIISEQQELPQRTIENVFEQAHLAGKVTPRMKIGDILINSGLITKNQLEEALASQERGKKIKLGKLLTSKGLITEEQLLMALALKFRLRYVDLSRITPTPEAISQLPADIAYGLQVLPLEYNVKRLIVATSEPTDYTIPDSIQFHTKRRVEMVVATPSLISSGINRYYPKEEYGVDEIISGMSEDAAQWVEPEDETEYVSEVDSHIITLVNRILLDGYAKGASDIHLEPSLREQPFRIRYRIDGVCRVAHQIPKAFKKAIVSRLKIMANLDISEKRKPQSGKILMLHQSERIEYRLETMPTVGGNEDAVLRILSSSRPRSFENMDFTLDNLERFQYLLSQPYGLILCVGPTGSGKTTTLHAALNHLSSPEVKIWTVEDPVEITQPWLRQVQVQQKIGLTFHEALRSFLRSDPDVIMVGEMRDIETSKTAIEAALTGHLVLSTLHTNSAAETIVRLIDMGMDTLNFADSLLGVLAQRLVRRLCDSCKKTYQPSKEEHDRLVEIYGPMWPKYQQRMAISKDTPLMKKVGCDLCGNTGYKGRIAIHELLVNTEKMKSLIRQKAPVSDLRNVAFEDGSTTLLMDGVQKIFEGLTDIDEILNACRFNLDT